MKNLLRVSVAVAALTLSATASAGNIGVAVIKADGSTHHVELADIHRIDVGAAGVTVHTLSGQSTDHAYGDIERIDIGVASSGIADIISDGATTAVWPTIVDTSVNIAGAPVGTPVKVFSSNGAAVASATTGEGTLSIDLQHVAAGTYIVTVGQKSVKIVKH